MIQKKIDEVIICECESPEHNIIIRYVEDDDYSHWDSIYVNIHLNGGGFFYRLKKSFYYLVFGKSKYGEYDEIILSPNDETIEKLQRVVNHLKKIKNSKEYAKLHI